MGSLGEKKKQYFKTHKQTRAHLHSTREDDSGEENSNEAKLCNILNLAAGLPTQLSVRIAPSFARVPAVHR